MIQRVKCSWGDELQWTPITPRLLAINPNKSSGRPRRRQLNLCPLLQVLGSLWKMNVMDIENTLKAVCLQVGEATLRLTVGRWLPNSQSAKPLGAPRSWLLSRR